MVQVAVVLSMARLELGFAELWGLNLVPTEVDELLYEAQYIVVVLELEARKVRLG